MILLGFIVLFALLLGAPIFAVMAGSAELAWVTDADASRHFVRFLAPDVLDERFAGSPILVTVPLFTFIGYVLAESKAPERIVRASDAFFGWMPGGLAIVCIVASAFFTTLTGGSAVTIVAVGALLYPALVKYGYPKDYSLGLVMTGGSLGLLLPPSLPILIYSLVAGIDFTKAFRAGVIPGLLIMFLLSLQAMYIGIKYKIPRTKPSLGEMGKALWVIKWELALPVIILGSLGVGLADVDEAAGIAAAYVLGIELFVHKDLKPKDLPRVVKSSMGLAGALVLIMAMATALTNYVIDHDVPNRVFTFVTQEIGVKDVTSFKFTLNVFMLVQGMLMEGISSILVAVPLLVPFAAEFHLSPFHLAMMFLLNLEIAFMFPPFGQNLFVASFRFNRPMTSLYRLIWPFIGILLVALAMIMYIPRLSTIAVEGDIREARAKSAQVCEPPRDAWMMECAQQDRNNPLPCTPEDQKCWLEEKKPNAADEERTTVLPADEVARKPGCMTAACVAQLAPPVDDKKGDDAAGQEPKDEGDDGDDADDDDIFDDKPGAKDKGKDAKDKDAKDKDAKDKPEKEKDDEKGDGKEKDDDDDTDDLFK